MNVMSLCLSLKISKRTWIILKEIQLFNHHFLLIMSYFFKAFSENFGLTKENSDEKYFPLPDISIDTYFFKCYPSLWYLGKPFQFTSQRNTKPKAPATDFSILGAPSERLNHTFIILSYSTAFGEISDPSRERHCCSVSWQGRSLVQDLCSSKEVQ